MKKLKGLLIAIVGVLALSIAMVKVNAATDYGSANGLGYEVSADQKTATYDILPLEKITLAAGDTICNRIEIQAVGEGAVLNTGNGSFKTGAIWTIPVPAGSKGTVTYTAGADQSARKYELIDEAGNVFAGKSISMAKQSNITFDSTNIITDTQTSKSFLRFKSNGGELKPKDIKIVLTEGTFEATAQKFKVSYYLKGESTPFATDNVASDQTALLPALWGYDLQGFYTDPDCTNTWDKTVTEERSIYCEYTQWGDEVYGDGNELSVDLITRCQSALPLGEEPTQVPRTIFSILGRVAYVAKVESINGVNSTHALNTGGNFSASDNVRGILIDAPSAGQISLYVSGANKTRNVSLYDAADAVLDTQSVTELQEITFNVSAAGKYRIGAADGSIHIFEAKFTPASAPTVEANMYQQASTDGTLVRYITIVKGLTVEQLEAVGAYTLNIQCESTNFNANCVVATKLMNNDAVYMAPLTDGGADHTFDGSNGEVYIVCILQVKDATHQEFVGKEITATMTVNGTELPVKTYRIA